MALLTVEQAAQEIGVKSRTIRDWIWRRLIEYVKIGRSVRIRQEVIRQLIDEGTIPASKESSNGR